MESPGTRTTEIRPGNDFETPPFPPDPCFLSLASGPENQPGKSLKLSIKSENYVLFAFKWPLDKNRMNVLYLCSIT
jgi:hypothetical protein